LAFSQGARALENGDDLKQPTVNGGLTKEGQVFKKIMVPVDLAHVASLGRALDCAIDLAQRHGAEITYVGITAPAPSALAHNMTEYEAKLKAFAASQAEGHDITATGHMVESHDPAAEMDKALMVAVREVQPDLIVMQSHKPGLTDYLFEGHGPYLAQHAKTSVMLVRD
jgi:nucleotide-binding universal stress UspA family protein